jgi:PEP-CTERM motif
MTTRLLVMVATLIVAAHAPAFAVPVGGTFQVGPTSVAGFITVSGHLVGEGVDVNFGGDTNLIRQPAQPGQIVLAGGFIPSDTASGTATINGTTFGLCALLTPACGEYSGNYAPPGGGVIAPAIGSQTTVGISVPFHLSMLVFAPIPPGGSGTTTNLVGDGSAIVTLRHASCGPAGGTCWELRDIQATFTVIPEPATLALVGGAVAALVLRTRGIPRRR